MFSMRPRTALLLGIIIFGSPIRPAWGQRGGRCTLDPKTYRSPSGTCELHVNPSTIYGQGKGAYRMTRNGTEVWARELAFTLWDAALTDDGTVAGYAYSGGLENYALDGTDGSREEGKLFVVILDPQGGFRLNAVFPRHGVFGCTSTVDRSVTDIILDPENDRFIVRMSEGDWSIQSETWRTYRLSTGELLDEFQFAHPQTTEREKWYLLAAKAVAGTPLILVNWEYTKWDETGDQQLASGGCFNLIDAGRKPVWELDLPDDYPPDFVHESRQTDMGAILRTDQGAQFDVRFVQDGQRVSFQVTPAGPDGWQVTETARTAYVTAPPEDSEIKPDTLEPMTLPHLGTIELQIDTPPLPAIRDIAYFDVDGRGRLGVLRREDHWSYSFLLVEPDGTIVWELGLRGLLGGDGSNATATWLGGERWLLIFQVHSGSGETAEWSTRAWWLDTNTRKATPIEHFAAEGARHVAASHDGGFVVIVDPTEGGSGSEAVVAFDREAQQRWRFDDAPEETFAWGRSSIAVMPDGKVIVSRKYGGALTILSAEGKFLKTFDCDRFFGPGPDGKWLTPEPNGTLLLPDGYRAGRVCRVQLDGVIKDRLAARLRDGRPVELAGFPDQIAVRVSPQGTMWACDEHALLRLSADGIVEQVLGEPPDAPTLRRIGGAKIDQAGNVYLAEERNLITHVFDATGRRVRLLHPSPGDFEKGGSCAIDVAADGRIFVGGLGFSPGGERLGFRKLPGDMEEPSVYEGRIRYQPHANRYWIISSEEATLVGEDNAAITTLKRRPNGDWLDVITGSAVAHDGSLVLAAGRSGMFDDDAVTLNLYGPSGEPLKTVALPRLEDRLGGIDMSLAYNGSYVIAGPFGYEPPRYLLLDAVAEPPKWYDLGPLVPYEGCWTGCWFVKDGKELWMYAEDARKVERFAAPNVHEQPPSVPPAPASAPASFAPADIVGEYYSGNGRGVNCYLELNADGQFAFNWRGCVGDYDGNSGPWSLDDGLVILKPTEANVREGFQGTATRLYPVRWGDRLYLVSDDEMIDFCSAVSLDWVFDRQGHAGRRSRFFYLRAGDEEKPFVGLPAVPEMYRQYLNGGFTASVIDIHDDGTFVISRGLRDGVIVGTKLNVAHGDQFGYKVTSVTNDQAVCQARSPRAARTDVKRGAAVRSFLDEAQDGGVKP